MCACEKSARKSYLFHDKKIYALVASALHIKSVLCVFDSVLAETERSLHIQGRGGPEAQLSWTWTSSTVWTCAHPGTALVLLVSGDLLAPKELSGFSATQVYPTSPWPPQFLDSQTLPASHPNIVW